MVDTLYNHDVVVIEESLKTLAPLSNVYATLYKVRTLSPHKSQQLVDFCKHFIDQTEQLLAHQDHLAFDANKNATNKFITKLHQEEHHQNSSVESLLQEL